MGTGTANKMSGGTFVIAHDFKPAAFNATGGTVEFAGNSSNQSLPASPYTFFNFKVDSGVDPFGNSTGQSYGIRGDWINNSAAMTIPSSTFTFNGSTAQSIGGTNATTFSNLTINNSASSVTVSTSAIVSAALILTSDLTTSGAATLTQPAAGTTSGAGDVVGTVVRSGTIAASTAYSFGNLNNLINYGSAGTRPSNPSVKLVEGTVSGKTSAIPRTYTIASGGSGDIATLRLRYLDSELGTNTESTLRLYHFEGGSWVDKGFTSRDSSANYVELTGILAANLPGDWAIASPNVAPNIPTSLAQFKSDGTTPIATGGFTNGTTVRLRGTVSDPDSGNT